MTLTDLASTLAGGLLGGGLLGLILTRKHAREIKRACDAGYALGRKHGRAWEEYAQQILADLRAIHVEPPPTPPPPPDPRTLQ